MSSIGQVIAPRGKATLACPKKGVDYRLDLQHLTTDSSLSSHALLQYSRAVRWSALLEYGVTQRPADSSAAGLAVYRLSAQLACPWRLLDLKADVAQQSRGRYRASAHGRYEVTVPNGPNVVGVPSPSDTPSPSSPCRHFLTNIIPFAAP